MGTALPLFPPGIARRFRAVLCVDHGHGGEDYAFSRIVGHVDAPPETIVLVWLQAEIPP